MKAARQVALPPMVAKVAHLPRIPQAKAVKAQEIVKEHHRKVKVDKAIAMLKTVKVAVVILNPIHKVKEAMEIAEIPKRKAKAVLMAEVKAKVMAIQMVAVKKETATIVAVKVAKMLNVHSPKVEMKAMLMAIPKVEMRATKVLKMEIPIPTPILKVMAIPTPIMRVEIPPIPIQTREQQIQTPTKTEKKATKVEILPKRAILTMTRLQQMAIPKAKMERVNPTVHPSHPKMKKPSIS